METVWASTESEGGIGERQAFLRRVSLGNLGYTLLVILWGAYVRATGSGAGCGDHWPLCNGEVIPRAERLQTAIEFLHRATSGISLLLVGVGYWLARRSSEKGSAVRRAAFLSVVAILLEALLGAGLVLLKLVEFNESSLRAVSIALHLVNTLFLIAALTTLVWAARDPRAYHRSGPRILPRSRMFWTALAGFLLLGTTGAITALGDTLFPASGVLEGLRQDLDSGTRFWVRLRVMHPVFAALWIGAVFVWSRSLETLAAGGVRSWLLAGVVVQFLLGILNWALMAPNAMQLLHLFAADLVFIAFWVSGLVHEAGKSRLSS